MPNEQRQPSNDYAKLMAAAAAPMPAGPPPTQGEPAGTQAQGPGLLWVERLLVPFRQALGDVATLVPRILERVGRLAESATGDVLLFRAAEASLPDFISSGKSVATSSAAYQRLKEISKRYPQAKDALKALTDDPRRLELPKLLDELKHAVRANRERGIERVHEGLGWLLKSNGKVVVVAYDLLDALSGELGETCLRRVRRQCALNELLEAGAADDASIDPLRQCFKSFGHPLSDRVSVIRCAPIHRPELLVLDHGRDRCFEIRQVGDSKGAQSWIEIRGGEAGRDYPEHGISEDGVTRHGIKLPLRVHDATQGLATWSVDRRLVHESPQVFSKASGVAMRAWDTGAGRTPVALFFVHYRDTDVGDYYELGLGCFIAPRDDPLSVGLATLGAVLVSTERSRKVGEIWGYPKQHVPHVKWKVLYRPAQVECMVELTHCTITLQLPRLAALAPSAMPMLSYTRKPAKEGGQWHRSTLMRSSRGDSVRTAGSSVHLSVQIHGKEAFDHPLLQELKWLGLIDERGRMQSQATLAQWCEHFSADLGAPTLVPRPEPEPD